LSALQGKGCDYDSSLDIGQLGLANSDRISEVIHEKKGGFIIGPTPASFRGRMGKLFKVNSNGRTAVIIDLVYSFHGGTNVGGGRGGEVVISDSIVDCRMERGNKCREGKEGTLKPGTMGASLLSRSLGGNGLGVKVETKSALRRNRKKAARRRRKEGCCGGGSNPLPHDQEGKNKLEEGRRGHCQPKILSESRRNFGTNAIDASM